jgi:hypothetical protein
MIDWSHEFGPVLKEHIMVGIGGRKKLPTSCFGNKEEKGEEATICQYTSVACP